jgi:hypothetical protein
MHERGASAPWRDAAWLADVDTWVDSQLSRLGLARTGPNDPRVRPWSIVIRVPTTGGDHYFKTTAPDMANDARLTALLCVRSPDVVLRPLAVDGLRGWMLLPTGGERLREVLDRGPDPGHWSRVLPRYARLQRAEEGPRQELLEAGALDRRSVTLERQFAELLADEEALAIGHPAGISTDELATLHGLRPRLAAACAELADGPVPESIQHDDFHDGNILVDGDRYRFVDWGDAAVGHPFGTLLVTLRSVAHRRGLPPVAPELAELRDRYLAAWTDLAPLEELRRIAVNAQWVAMIGRVLVWRAALELATPEEREADRDAVPEWLRDFAAAAPA